MKSDSASQSSFSAVSMPKTGSTEKNPAGAIDRRSSMIASILLFLTLAGVVFIHLRGVADPFDDSHCGQMSGWYGYSQRAFAAHGFLRLRLCPSALFFADSPQQIPYLNHPFWPHLWVAPFFRFLGEDEAALRYSILPVFLLGAFFLHRAVDRVSGKSAAALATAVYVAWPMMIHNGGLVDAFSFSTAAAIAVLAAYLRWSDRSDRTSYLLFSGAALCLGLSDWVGFFVGPVLAVDILATRRPFSRSFGRIALAAVPFLVALVLDVAWMAIAAGSLAEGLRTLKALTGASTGQGAEVLAMASIDRGANLRNYAQSGFGWLGLGLATVGFLSSIFRGVKRIARPLDRCALLLFFSGALPLAVFVDRTAEIEFWMMLAAPGIAVLAVIGILSIADVVGRAVRSGDRWRGLSPTLVAAAVVILSIHGGLSLRETYRSDHNRERGRSLGAIVRDDDIVLFSQDFGAGRFYAPSASTPDIRDRAAFERVVTELRQNPSVVKRIFWGCPTTEATAHIAWMIDYVPVEARTRPPIEISWPIGKGDTYGRAYLTEIDVAKVLAR